MLLRLPGVVVETKKGKELWTIIGRHIAAGRLYSLPLNFQTIVKMPWRS